jgi:nucleotide-binding universal stress UspA family protein
MKLQKILVPVDFSESSRAALDYAAMFAARFGAEVTVLHVVEPVPLAVPFAVGPMPDPGSLTMSMEMENSAKEGLERFLAPPAPELNAQRKVTMGPPAEEILRIAEGDGVDLVVMGTHGRRGLARLLMGSVASEVVKRASCPVMTVRSGE